MTDITPKAPTVTATAPRKVTLTPRKRVTHRPPPVFDIEPEKPEEPEEPPIPPPTPIRTPAPVKPPAPKAPTASQEDMYHLPALIDPQLADWYMTVLGAGLQWCTFAPAPKSRLVHGWQRPSPGEYRTEAQRTADEVMESIIHRVQQHSGRTVISAFLNYYQTGTDYCPFHADQYKSDSYTVSLGGPREFQTRIGNSGPITRYQMKSGDLYFMSRKFHTTHKHSVPKVSSAKKRISILFLVQ